MKPTLVAVVNGVRIERVVVRSCGDARDEMGRKIWRSCVRYFANWPSGKFDSFGSKRAAMAAAEGK